MGRALRQSERSDFYGSILEPRATPAILAAADARPAETAAEREARESRRKTTPAPRGRRPGPRGRGFDLDEIDAESER
jgi:hypothetical protein